MKLASIVLAISIAFPFAVSAETFAPEACEFSVEFPGKYRTKKIIAVTGQSILAAQSLPGSKTLLNAECWPREDISISEYADIMRPMMTDRGMEVFSVAVKQENTGEVVTVAAAMGKESKRVHVRFESFFGPKTRLDLMTVQDEPLPTQEQVAFRKSVRLK